MKTSDPRIRKARYLRSKLNRLVLQRAHYPVDEAPAELEARIASAQTLLVVAEQPLIDAGWWLTRDNELIPMEAAA